MWKPNRSTVVRALALSTALSLAPALSAAPTNEPGSTEKDLKVVQLPLRADAPKTIDPCRGSTTYDNRACSMVYDTLLQYKYLKRPFELEPALLETMPTVSEDGLTYTFKLKQGIRFHDDECFPDGKGRQVVSSDVFYSWKRMADAVNDPKSWWLFRESIVGFDAFRDRQRAAIAAFREKNPEATTEEANQLFDYEDQVEGFRILDDFNFQVVLTEPVYRFMWILSMFQTSVVPREAVDFYGSKFSVHPVGTGPYMLEEWHPLGMNFVRNPTYREEFFPTEFEEGDEAYGVEDYQGATVPIIDRVEFTFYKSDQPMWLRFEEGTLGYTQVPAENYPTAFNPRTKKLKSEYKRRGVVGHDVPLLDFIFRMFNMEDELVGGDSERAFYLRKAIVLAIDFDEFNTTFYNDKVIPYDGMIPPGLDGFPGGDDHRVKPDFRGKNLDLAKECLAKAGYPNGEGLPMIDYYSSSNANGSEQADLLVRQLSKIGVKLNVRLMDFSTLIAAIDKKQASMFSFAWSSDYPDAENNLALFYGPNESPGNNHGNYHNEEFDRLYEQIRSMGPSPERTAIYVQMRDMVLEDYTFAGAMARKRSYLVQPWLRNMKPTEQFYNWIKYLDLDEDARE